MRETVRPALVLVLLIGAPVKGRAQATPSQATTVAAPPPATKLEAFKPAAGSVLTIAYQEMGEISGVSIDAREMRDARGAVVRGVIVEIRESQYRRERSFIDADELPELLKGIDALLEVKTNPTTFPNFEVRYTTRGELQITAFNSGAAIRYAVQTGRVLKAQSFIDESDMRRLRILLAGAQEKLAAAPARD